MQHAVPFKIYGRSTGLLDVPPSRGMTPGLLRSPCFSPEEGKVNLTLVVACALVDADKRVLIAQRPEGKTLAGLWEFPGGKVEPGERPEATLICDTTEESVRKDTDD